MKDKMNLYEVTTSEESFTVDTEMTEFVVAKTTYDVSTLFPYAEKIEIVQKDIKIIPDGPY